MTASNRLHNFEVIDAHAHLGPYFNFHVPGNDAASMVEEMDRVGISQAWISSHGSLASDYVRGNDDAVRAAREFPGRFLVYATPNPNYGSEVEEELNRLIEEPEVRMIKLHPAVHEYPVDGPAYEPVWRAARAQRLPVLVHVWKGCRFCDPMRFAHVAARHERVVFLLAHCGGPDGVDDSVHIAKDQENVLLDFAGSQAAYGLIERLVREVGAEKMVFGSDTPFLSPAGQLGRVLYAEISDDDKQRILAGNARGICKAAS